MLQLQSSIMVSRDLDFNAFKKDYLMVLPKGSIAFHAQLYPRPYPTNADLFERVLQDPGTEADASAARFHKAFEEIFGNGVLLQRLRVLQRPKTPRETALVKADIRLQQACQSFGGKQFEEIRYAWFEDVTPNLQAQASSKLATDYLNGEQQNVPRASFWAAYQPGQTTADFVYGMHYDYNDPALFHGELLPLDDPTQAYERYWRTTYSKRSIALGKIATDFGL